MKRLQIMLTQQCNSCCSYCMVPRDAQDLNEELIGHIPEIVESVKADAVILFGGEPLLREDLCYKIKDSLNPETRIILPTNGKLLTDKHVEDFGNVLISSNGTIETCHLTGQTFVPEILNIKNKDKCTIGMRIIPESANRMKIDFDYFHEAGFTKYNIVPIIEMDWNESQYDSYMQGVMHIISKIPRENIWTWRKGGICVPYQGTTCMDQKGDIWGCARFCSEKIPISKNVSERHFTKCLECNIRNFCFHNCYYLNQNKTGSLTNPYKGTCKFAQIYKKIFEGNEGGI